MFSSAYIKGRSHLKCDDYALHSLKCGFLCDGCSGANHPEIGAKILPFYAVSHLDRFIWENNGEYNFKDYVFYLEKQLSRFMKEFDPGKMPIQTYEDIFSCTLGGVVQHKYNIYMSLMGDGCIYYELVNGDKFITIVNYKQNYPFYISYLFRQDQFDLWKDIPDNDIEVQQYKMDENCDWVKIEHSIPLNTLYVTITQSIDDIKLVVVTSDGPEQCDNFSTIEALYELVNFKSFGEDFAWRRLVRFEQNLHKNGNYCQDDISMIVYHKD